MSDNPLASNQPESREDTPSFRTSSLTRASERSEAGSKSPATLRESSPPLIEQPHLEQPQTHSFTSPEEASQPTPSASLVDSLLREASGGHRVGDPVIGRARRRTRKETASVEFSPQDMVRLNSPGSDESEYESDSSYSVNPTQPPRSPGTQQDQPKKKRVRHLTQPQEYAVLNHLLDQVRSLFSRTIHYSYNSRIPDRIPHERDA
jgi:hypothetical protein